MDITEAIFHLLEDGTRPRDPENRPWPGPEEVNSGLCEDFAYEVADMVEEAEVRGPENYGHSAVGGEFGGHVWITDGSLHYDAEAPWGVDDWKNLPFFR